MLHCIRNYAFDKLNLLESAMPVVIHQSQTLIIGEYKSRPVKHKGAKDHPLSENYPSIATSLSTIIIYICDNITCSPTFWSLELSPLEMKQFSLCVTWFPRVEYKKAQPSHPDTCHLPQLMAGLLFWSLTYSFETQITIYCWSDLDFRSSLIIIDSWSANIMSLLTLGASNIIWVHKENALMARTTC